MPFLPVKELLTVEPNYTEEARKAQLEGTVALYVEVPPYGIAENVRVLRSLGMGLEEKAVEAVRQWRFEPATRDGELVTAATIVLVDFHLPADVKMNMGLDERAKKSLRKATFKPATKDGKPVTVMLAVEVNFSVR